jgi:hypothetical protein
MASDWRRLRALWCTASCENGISEQRPGHSPSDRVGEVEELLVGQVLEARQRRVALGGARRLEALLPCAPAGGQAAEVADVLADRVLGAQVQLRGRKGSAPGDKTRRGIRPHAPRRPCRQESFACRDEVNKKHSTGDQAGCSLAVPVDDAVLALVEARGSLVTPPVLEPSILIVETS